MMNKPRNRRQVDRGRSSADSEDGSIPHWMLDEHANPTKVARTEFIGRIFQALFLGTIVYGSLVVWLNRGSTFLWPQIEHDSAYLWLTASVVLILALAAASSLTLDTSTPVGDSALDIRIAHYDAARLSLLRQLMLNGATIGATLAIVVASAGAAEYLADLDSNGKSFESNFESVLKASAMFALGLLVVFAASALSMTLWVFPRRLGPTKLEYPRDRIQSALDFICASTESEPGWIRSHSLELLTLAIAILCPIAFVVLSDKFGTSNYSDEWTFVNWLILPFKPLLHVTILVFIAYQAYRLFVFQWCLVQPSGRKEQVTRRLMLILIPVLGFLFFASFSLIIWIATPLTYALIVIGTTAVILCASAVTRLGRLSITAWGLRVRARRSIIVAGKRRVTGSFEEYREWIHSNNDGGRHHYHNE